MNESTTYPITDFDVTWQNIIYDNIKKQANEKTKRNGTNKTVRQTGTVKVGK